METTSPKSSLVWALNISVVALVLLWLFPTLGLLVSSFRTGDQISATGWWKAMFSTEQVDQYRVGSAETQVLADGVYVIDGNFYAENGVTPDELAQINVSRFATSSRDLGAYGVGTDDVGFDDGETLRVDANGNYRYTSSTEISGRGQRVFLTAVRPPSLTLNNYDTVLGRGVLTDLIVYLALAAVAGGVVMAALRAYLPTRSREIGVLFGGVFAYVALTYMTTGAAASAISGGVGDGPALLARVAILLVAFGIYLFVSRGNPQSAKPLGIAAAIAVIAMVVIDFGLGANDGLSNSGDSMGKAFLNTLTVVIPATIIPILIAAFAAYALAWMDFPGRALLIAAVVGLLVVPLQLALIPLLSLHNDIGIGKGYLGVWLAHTGFGLPLAIYLLRNYMVGLPKDIIENAKVDGATDFQIFTKIILPLSFPALASFAIFQFLWTWNDLLVSLVFLIDSSGQTTVMTKQIVELLGTRGGDWEILATAAFVSIAVPLAVFFAMQKYLVRGLLAGSVK